MTRSHILPYYAGLLLTYYCGIGHYSTYNLLSGLVILALKLETFYPIVVSNSIGLSLTWYFACSIDNTISVRMMERNRWTLTKYIFGDICLHILPFLWGVYMLYSIQKGHVRLQRDHPLVVHCGLYTAFMNMMWSMTTQFGFRLDNCYVYEPPLVWNKIWFMNYLFHSIPMFLMGF
jgi:hypothetical protein